MGSGLCERSGGVKMTSEATVFLRQTENISYHVASGAISEDLLREIIVAIMSHTFEDDSELAYRIALTIGKDESW